MKVGKLSKLPAESVMEVVVMGRPYAICHVGGGIRALDGVCPHQGGPLGQGQINEGRVVCPFHLWEFDCRSGENDFDPRQRVETYDVTIEDDDILLQVP